MKSKEFIKYYNLIDAELEGSGNQYEGFSQKVKNSTNNVIKNRKNDLLSYGELRNAIVHRHIDDNFAIAEPHPVTVANLKKIYEQITNPKRVIPTFQMDVTGAKEDEYINDILQNIRDFSFSQFPIFNETNQVIELINTNTIARWLANKLSEDGGGLIIDAKIKDFINDIEFKHNYKFISRNATIYDAFQLFIDEININKRNLDVLFITDAGKRTEKLLGMATIEDVAKEMAEVENNK